MLPRAVTRVGLLATFDSSKTDTQTMSGVHNFRYYPTWCDVHWVYCSMGCGW